MGELNFNINGGNNKKQSTNTNKPNIFNTGQMPPVNKKSQQNNSQPQQVQQAQQQSHQPQQSPVQQQSHQPQQSPVQQQPPVPQQPSQRQVQQQPPYNVPQQSQVDMINKMNQPVNQNQQQNNSNPVQPQQKKKLFSKNKKDENNPIIMDEQFVAKQYKEYRIKRQVVLWGLIIGIVAIVGLALYNSVFKHTLTASEAVSATNNANNQYVNQQWDSGVQSFLQANLKEMLNKNFQATGAVKQFSVDNISVERNQPMGAGLTSNIDEYLFICFFSADVTTPSGTVRTYFTIPIKTSATNGFQAAGDVMVSERKAYSDNGTTIVDSELLKFDERERNDESSRAFEKTVTNFLHLGYDTDTHDVGDLYKGTNPLNFKGKFNRVTKCDVYDTPNALGFNAHVLYEVVLENGLQLDNTAYFTISKNDSGTYIINNIL